jgi:phosphoglycerate dehydrogenase-like enzyme
MQYRGGGARQRHSGTPASALWYTFWFELWLRDRPQKEALGALPPEVTLRLIPVRGPLPATIRRAEFLVPPYGDRRVLALMSQMERLRVVQAISAGVEWLVPRVPAGVTVCNARGTRDIAVAEWVLTVVLAMAKDIPRLPAQQARGRWAPSLLDELAGMRVQIVGYGSIGRAVEERLLPFGVGIDRVASHPRAGVHGVGKLRNLLPAGVRASEHQPAAGTPRPRIAQA